MAHEPAERGKVLHGSEGWFFLTNDTNRVIDQVTGSFQLDRKQVDIWLRTIELRFRFFERTGIRYGHFVVPNKEIVFARFLPGDIRTEAFGPRPVRQLIQALEKREVYGFHYLEALMTSNLEVECLYRKLDTHWGFPGAFLTYGHILSVLFPERPEIQLTHDKTRRILVEADGDLGDKLDPPRREATIVIEPVERRAKKIYDNEVNNLGHIQIWERTDSFFPRVLLFHDSFSNWIIPFLAESTSRLVCLHTQQLDFDLIRYEQPDAVVIETIERFLIEPPNDVSGATIHELLQKKDAPPSPWAGLSEWEPA